MREPIINLHLGNCMQAMKGMKDKQYDLAIVDPPYGIGEDGGKGTRPSPRRPNSYLRPPKYAAKGWDKSAPTSEYFSELSRLTKNQIVFGANHFISRIPFDSPCWVVWDKNNGDADFADCELAWTSFKTAVRKFTIHKFYETSGGKDCIHPTQKPVKLYRWLLKNYAKPGDKILDTHGGSMSIAIACYDMGFDLDLWEIDKDYYEAGVRRFNDHKKQLKLFRA